MQRHLRRLSSIITLLVGLAVATSVAAAQALPGLPGAASAPPSLPPGIVAAGSLEAASVLLDGVPLFPIAAPLHVSGGEMSIEARLQFVESALAELVAMRGSTGGTVYDPATLRVSVRPDGAQAIISARDAGHPMPLPILTVTSDDAKYNRLPVSVLAAQWRAILQSALVRALQKRQPAVLHRHFEDVWKLALALVAITLVLGAFVARIRRRERRLAEQVATGEREIDRAQAQGAGADADSAAKRLHFMGLAIRAADPAMSLALLQATRGLVVWALVLLWFGGLVWTLALFPQTTPLGELLFNRAYRIAFVWIGAALAIRIAAVGIAQFARYYAAQPRLRGEEDARRILRLPTVVNTAVGVLRFVAFFIALLATLSLLGISTGSVLTIGGLVALAVSLAAQNLLRDFLNGFLALVEDQYVVGDYVTIGTVSGLVEHMTLRIVQIRDAQGSLVTIPQGSVTQVVNASRNWSRVDYRVAVEAGADPERALGVLRAAIDELAADPAWRDALEMPVEWTGIDALSTAGILLRASLRTAPLRQFEVKRELNTRVLAALRKEGIALGARDAYVTG
jgi:small-conductance mechanosensitive channel